MSRTVPAPRRATTPGGSRKRRGPIVGDATFTLGDDIIAFDTTAVDRVAQLLAAAAVPQGTIVGAEVFTGANNAILTAVAGDTVGGGATSTVTPALRTVSVQSDGLLTWTIVSIGA